MSAKISFIFPSRCRPDKFFRALANINDFSDSKNYEIICAFDDDDHSMNNEAVRTKILEYENVKYFYGQSSGKVFACNRELPRISEEASIVCLHSDDFEYLEYGFDEEIRNGFLKHFPGYDGALHVSDGFQSRTITYSILGINFVKRFGYLYNPIYASVYADNELTEVAKKLNKYALVDNPKIRHNHPIFNLCNWDDLYRANESPEHYQKDGETFQKRKANNFGL